MAKIIEIIFIIVLIIIGIMNILIKMLYNELKDETNEIKISGFEIVKNNAENDPHIIKKKGYFSDHYNKDRNVVKLTPEVFDGEDIYAAVIAICIALETKEEFKNVSLSHKISSFLVISSYILIVIGAFINNYNIILYGFVLFIIAFLIEIWVLSIYTKKDYDIISEKAKIIKPYDEYEEFIFGGFLLPLARLPISFINYFR